MNLDVTADRLRELLHYERATGVFTWLRKPSSKVAAGAVAGHLMKDHGYRVIKIDGVLYRAHRLAWLHVYGYWPDRYIDHINGLKDDNRIENLRDVGASGNVQNQIRAHKCNGTGFLGVSEVTSGFEARIRVYGKLLKLGVSNTPEEAHQVYVEAKRVHHATGTL